jgi:hypothetical protein
MVRSEQGQRNHIGWSLRTYLRLIWHELDNFSGVARNAAGNPLANGDYTITFRIYKSMTGEDLIWSEEQNGVTVRDGRFSATLGIITPLPVDQFNSPDRFVGVQIKDYEEAQPRQRLSSVPYAFHAGNGVPVGTVIDWWRPDANTPIPAGYAIANGSVLNDPDSPLHGKTLLNLNERFVRGVTNPAQIGVGGGSPTHSHTIDLPQYSWSATIDPPPFTSSTLYPVVAEGSRTEMVVADVTGKGVLVSSYYHYHDLEVNQPAFMAPMSIDLPAASTSATHLPPYVGLLKLVRTR